MGIEYLKSPARLLYRDQVNKEGLDLSKKVLWVSVSQLAAKLQAVKVGGLKKILLHSMSRGDPGSTSGQGGIQYFRKQVEVGGWLVNCLRL